MTDATHLIRDPDLAAADAEFMRAIVHLEAGREFIRRAMCQAPHKAQPTATDADWIPIGSVASRVVDQIKREAAE